MSFIRVSKCLTDTRLNIALLFLLMIFSSSVFAQSGSDYLKALEGEAENLSLDKGTKAGGGNFNPQIPQAAETKPEWDPGESGAIRALQPGLSIAHFAEVLKNNYIGSYIFYKRLSNESKQEVYNYYLETPDSEKVRDKIIQVSKQR